MSYKVVKKYVIGGEDHEGRPFNVKRYYITWGGVEPKADDPYLSVWADGSMTAVWGESKVFLYDDQWDGIIGALRQAKNDKAAERVDRAAKWLAENGDKTEHYGAVVDLSINDAKRILASAPMRRISDGKAEVYHGTWLHLCRTDLSDDVCTLDANDSKADLEQLRQHYLARIKFGARTNDRFAVVDALSDG